MRMCSNCRSYALNDDPEKKLCDKCWRDMKIADLEGQLAEAIGCVLMRKGRLSMALSEKEIEASYDRIDRMFDDLNELVYKARIATHNKYRRTRVLEPDSVVMQLIREELDKVEGRKASVICPHCGWDAASKYVFGCCGDELTHLTQCDECGKSFEHQRHVETWFTVRKLGENEGVEK